MLVVVGWLALVARDECGPYSLIDWCGGVTLCTLWAVYVELVVLDVDGTFVYVDAVGIEVLVFGVQVLVCVKLFDMFEFLRGGLWLLVVGGKFVV